MTGRTDALSPRELLGWLLTCDSHDEMHAAIEGWLLANPRPRSIDENIAHAIDVLAGAKQSGYDPRVIPPIIAEFEAILARVAGQPGRAGAVGEYNAGTWVESLLHEPHPALGGRCPVSLLNTAGGVARVHDLLLRHALVRYGHPVAPDDLAREAANLGRLLAAHTRLLADLGTYSTEQLAVAGCDAHAMRHSSLLLGVTHAGTWHYPVFQFNSQGMPFPEIAQVLAALGDQATSWDVVVWFVEANEDLNGRTPLETWAVDRGSVVAAAAQANWFARE